MAQPEVLPTEPPVDPIVPMLMGDEILIPHEPVSSPLDFPNIAPQAAPALLGSGYTVTVANPTPPTNISYVACGTPPNYTAAYGADPRSPTYRTLTDDLNLMGSAGTPAALTVISSPIGGGSGPVSEATGTVVVVTAPGSVTAAPTQSVSVQGNFTTTPNASHPSGAPPAVLPTISSLTPAAPVGTGGTSDLVVIGTGFRPDSIVYVAGTRQNTQFLNTTTLHVLNAPKRSSAGNSTVEVITAGTSTGTVNWVFT
jgi:hypothetical protein